MTRVRALACRRPGTRWPITGQALLAAMQIRQSGTTRRPGTSRARHTGHLPLVPARPKPNGRPSPAMRLFDASLGLDVEGIELTPVRVVQTTEVTHIRYAIGPRVKLELDDRGAGG
jgi:hypothetical protein